MIPVKMVAFVSGKCKFQLPENSTDDHVHGASMSLSQSVANAVSCLQVKRIHRPRCQCLNPESACCEEHYGAQSLLLFPAFLTQNKQPVTPGVWIPYADQPIPPAAGPRPPLVPPVNSGPVPPAEAIPNAPVQPPENVAPTERPPPLPETSPKPAAPALTKS
jgi:hypothetical protein